MEEQQMIGAILIPLLIATTIDHFLKTELGEYRPWRAWLHKLIWSAAGILFMLLMRKP